MVMVPIVPPATAATMMLVGATRRMVMMPTVVVIAVVVVAMAVVEIIAPIRLALETTHAKQLVLVVVVDIFRVPCGLWLDLHMRGRFQQPLLDMCR